MIVLNLRRKFNKTLTLIFLFLMICFLLKFTHSNINLNNISVDYNSISSYIFSKSIPAISQLRTTDFNGPKGNLLYSVIYGELPIISSLNYIAETDENDEKVIDSDNSNTLIEHASTDLSTQVVESNVPNSYTDSNNGVLIKNGTNYELTSDIWDTSNLEINKNDVIIFHTHTCESYTPTENYNYEESGTFRTIDLNFSVARVGSVLAEQLCSYGFNTFHDTTYHDYPNYSGSYGRSMATVENLLLSHSGTDIIIDLHRDAIADSSYAPSVIIGDEKVAQLMFVIGTDGGGLEHPNWRNNLKFAIAVQQKANELYPGLFRSILLRNSRYNQQLGNAACIIEVGATGNTLEEAMGSMKYLALVLNSILQ